jgi:hypothetical protein
MTTPSPAASSARDRRIALWLAALSALAYLPFNHCHFSATDETGVFDPALSLYRRGTLAVEPGMHIFPGRDGRSYSHFAIGQTILALPFIAVGDALARAIPPELLRAAIGRDDEGYIDQRESAEIFVTSAYAPIATGVLLAVFYAFERGLGASRRGALLAAALLGASSYVAAHSVYFLQHTTEAIAILGGFAALHAWRRTGRLGWLAAGSALASAVVIVRVPAAVSGPALAAYLLFTLVERRPAQRQMLRVAAAIALPAAAVAAIHLGVNYAKWGAWIESPMIAQSFLLRGSLRVGLTGLLLSPGASLFAYSPLLVLLPLWLPGFWRRHRAEAIALLAIAASFLWLCGRFLFWHGLWSAPGPRYLFALTPLLMLPLGPWLDAHAPRWQRALAIALAAWGAVVQLALVTAHWRHTAERMGYEQELTVESQPFLYEPLRTPIAAHLGSLRRGEIDSYLWALWHGVPGRAPNRPLAGALLLAWALALALCARRLYGSIRRR